MDNTYGSCPRKCPHRRITAAVSLEEIEVIRLVGELSLDLTGKEVTGWSN